MRDINRQTMSPSAHISECVIGPAFCTVWWCSRWSY